MPPCLAEKVPPTERGLEVRYVEVGEEQRERTLFTDLADLAVRSELGSHGTAIGAERLGDLLDGLSDLFSDGCKERNYMNDWF